MRFLERGRSGWLSLLVIVAPACGSPGGGDAAADAAPHDAADVLAPADAAGDVIVMDAPAPDGAPSDAADVVQPDTQDVATDGTPPVDSGSAARCTASGGVVTTNLCCASAGDFPDTCSVGACSCAPSSSHMVMTCVCPSGERMQCFDTTVGCH